MELTIYVTAFICGIIFSWANYNESVDKLSIAVRMVSLVAFVFGAVGMLTYFFV